MEQPDDVITDAPDEQRHRDAREHPQAAPRPPAKKPKRNQKTEMAELLRKKENAYEGILREDTTMDDLVRATIESQLAAAKSAKTATFINPGFFEVQNGTQPHADCPADTAALRTVTFLNWPRASTADIIKFFANRDVRNVDMRVWKGTVIIICDTEERHTRALAVTPQAGVIPVPTRFRNETELNTRLPVKLLFDTAVPSEMINPDVISDFIKVKKFDTALVGVSIHQGERSALVYFNRLDAQLGLAQQRRAVWLGAGTVAIVALTPYRLRLSPLPPTHRTAEMIAAEPNMRTIEYFSIEPRPNNAAILYFATAHAMVAAANVGYVYIGNGPMRRVATLAPLRGDEAGVLVV